MSNWRDNVRSTSASFRGVPFVVETEELDTGRRGVTHEYPFRKGPGNREDTGGVSDVFTIEAFVIGDSYLDQKKALIAELNKGGPGLLVHPYYGALTVKVGKVKVAERAADGGMARFTIEFHDSTDPMQPSAAVDSVAAVSTSAAALQSSAVATFNAAMVKIANVRDAVKHVITATSNTINGLLSNVSMVSEDIGEIASLTQGLANDATALAAAPGTLVTTLLSTFDSLRKAVEGAANVSDPLAMFLGLYNQDAGQRPTPTTPDQVLAQVNFDAVHALIQRCAVIQASQVLVGMTFVSYDEAIAARDRVMALIDDQAETAADDTYPDLVQLGATLVAAVPGDDGDLPRLISYTPRVTLPSLVVAQQLYGAQLGKFASLEDAEADFIARNDVAHPGFVRGGQALEVVSSA